MSEDFFLMNEYNRKKYFSNAIIKAREKLETLDDEVFFILNGLKQYIFSFSSDEEKYEFVRVATEYIKNRGDIAYQLVETLSVVYKFLKNDCQNMVFDTVLPYCEELIMDNRGIITVSIFIKNTHKSYNEEQKRRCDSFFQSFKKACDSPQTKDTYSYTEENYFKEFKPSKKARILLLIAEFQTATSFLQPPLCFLGVATQLKEKNIDFDFLDNRVYSYPNEKILEFIEQYDYVAITSSPLDQVQTYFLDHRHTIFCQLVNDIKTRVPKTMVLVCGSHGTIKPDFLINNTKADIVVKGEYDFQLPNLLEKLIKQKDVLDIPNLVIREIGNQCIYTEIDESKMHPNEWENSTIDYSIIDFNDYYGYQYIGNTHLKKKRWSVIQASRGCPYNCIFCYNFYTNKVRFKNIDNLIKEMLQMKEMNVSEMFFIDQTFTVNKYYIRKLCKAMIKNSINIAWTCETRVDLIDYETMQLMKQAGCTGIWFGIESFDENVLAINKKGYSEFDYSEMLKILQETQIDYRAFIMLGMYGDDNDSLKYTVDQIINNKIRISKTIVKCKERFGTELFDAYTPDKTKKELYCFEQLGLRSGTFATNITEKDYDLQIKRLMNLNKM